MDKPLSMDQTRVLLNMQHRNNRFVTRLLQSVASERGESFRLFKLGKGWFTTEPALRAILPPEMFQHETSEVAELRSQVENLAAVAHSALSRVESLEARVIARERRKTG